MDVGEEMKQLFASARKAASNSREQAANMRKGLKISRRIAKASLKLGKGANLDEMKTKPEELEKIRLTLAEQLKEITGMVDEIRALDFVGREEIVTRLDLAVYEMGQDFAKNWPEFERRVIANA